MESRQEHFPGMSERDILEGLKPKELVDYRDYLLSRYSDLEHAIHLVNDVLDGYGYVEDHIILGEN